VASIVTVLGTRPEVIKLSSLLPLLNQRWSHALVHTGQHYDEEMVNVFFHDLKLPPPDYTLTVGSGSHAKQIAQIILRLEEILQREEARLVIVQGDTNTTLGGALAARQLGIPVAHVEAGCRSHNRQMPEEQNRIVVDHLADYLFTPDTIATENLLREGIAADRIFMTGSTGIDACLRNWGYATTQPILDQLNIERRTYGLVTVHRAANTVPEVLPGIFASLNDIATHLPLIFPMHPRTRAVFEALGLADGLHPDIHLLPPLGYLDSLALIGNALVVLTDSGGVQEETAALGIPTLILREETEWQAYVNAGTHRLVGMTPETIVPQFHAMLRDGSLEVTPLRALPASAGASENIAAILATIVPYDQPIRLPVTHQSASEHTA
jgi:UDP-N-acetylglucosamine 2-epimerase (non-hydrolysing)